MNAEFDESTLFLTNKHGFPIDDSTWNNMWKFAEYQQPGAKDKIQSLRAIPIQDLSEPKVPVPPLTFPIGSSTASKISAIQKYFSELQYNHTGTQFFEIKKYRSFTGLMEDAKQMIKESLPIKCLEAVVLGIYLTNKIEDLTRFAIGFKSAFNGHVHRHVVLGLYCRGTYGALGISRRDDLMYKPLKFKSLTDLIMDYKQAYQRHWHTLKRVKVGMAICKNPHSFEPLPWKGLTVFPSNQPFEEMRVEIEKFAKLLRHGVSFSHPPARQERLPRSASLPALSHPGSPQRSAQEPALRSRQQQSQTQPSALRKKSGFFLRV